MQLNLSRLHKAVVRNAIISRQDICRYVYLKGLEHGKVSSASAEAASLREGTGDIHFRLQQFALYFTYPRLPTPRLNLAASYNSRL